LQLLLIENEKSSVSKKLLNFQTLFALLKAKRCLHHAMGNITYTKVALTTANVKKKTVYLDARLAEMLSLVVIDCEQLCCFSKCLYLYSRSFGFEKKIRTSLSPTVVALIVVRAKTKCLKRIKVLA
jgi:hypothetical protein